MLNEPNIHILDLSDILSNLIGMFPYYRLVYTIRYQLNSFSLWLINDDRDTSLVILSYVNTFWAKFCFKMCANRVQG